MWRGRGGKEKEWTDCAQSDIRAFGITGDWKTMVLKPEVWVEAATEGGRRFMAAWREKEEDAARHRQEKREATTLGKLQSHTGSVEFCKATPIGLADESWESLYGRETDRDHLRNADLRRNPKTLRGLARARSESALQFNQLEYIPMLAVPV